MKRLVSVVGVVHPGPRWAGVVEEARQRAVNHLYQTVHQPLEVLEVWQFSFSPKEYLEGLAGKQIVEKIVSTMPDIVEFQGIPIPAIRDIVYRITRQYHVVDIEHFISVAVDKRKAGADDRDYFDGYRLYEWSGDIIEERVLIRR